MSATCRESKGAALVLALYLLTITDSARIWRGPNLGRQHSREKLLGRVPNASTAHPVLLSREESCGGRLEQCTGFSGTTVSPYLAPGRLDVPVSRGTPTKAASSPSADACMGSFIMEQTPTGRATNWALGGTLNCEPQRQGAPCPGGQRSPMDAPGEEPEVAGDHGLRRGVAAAAAADSLRAQSLASQDSSWLQPAQSRRLILPHRL